jgi:hypothetical protein
MKGAVSVILFCLVALFALYWSYGGLFYAVVGICVVIVFCAALLAFTP